ncbi:MAG TPA: ABC transporter permease [Clostridia bacterium]|nr:ABC transporter permease [Clostridia bacterium]
MDKKHGLMAKPLKDISFSFFAILLAFVIGSILILILGESPIKVYTALIEGALGSTRAVANTLSKTVPLIFTGLAVSVALRSGLFNIGVEGQLHLGAMAGISVALALPNAGKLVIIPLILLAGIVTGGVWGSIPGYIKARHGINEVIVSIMLNYIAILFTSYLVNDPLKAEGNVAQTKIISEAARLTKLVPNTQLTTSLFIAIAVIIIAYLLLWKTSLGFRLRAVGSNASAGEAAGINPGKSMIIAMAISGGIAALAGLCEVLGKYYRFIEGFSPSYGFTGIAVAILGRNHPFGVILTALLFGILDAGALRMDRLTSISSNMVMVIQSLVILFVAAPEIIKVFSLRKEHV